MMCPSPGVGVHEKAVAITAQSCGWSHARIGRIEPTLLCEQVPVTYHKGRSGEYPAAADFGRLLGHESDRERVACDSGSIEMHRLPRLSFAIH
jgi:hypothetical protein